MDSMRCHSCGHENPPGGVYCQQCGVRLAQEAPAQALGVDCPRCGAHNEGAVRFCTSCGYAFESSGAKPAQPGAAPAAPEPPKEPTEVRIVAVMKDGSDGQSHVIRDKQTDIGKDEGDIVIADDPYLSPRHARIEARGSQYFIRDLDSFNGIYFRIREAVPIKHGDMILVGQQVLKFETLSDAESPLGPAMMGGVLVFGTPEVPRLASLHQYTTEGVCRDVHYVYRDETILGRETGDIVFTDDPFLSRKHASITVDRAAKRFVLRDLGSSNGTCVRFRGERELSDGDHVRLGRHLFRFEMKGGA